MKRNAYLLPALGTAPLAVLATQPSRMVEILEDGATTAQGIVLFFAQDNYTRGYTYLPAKEPVILGNKVAHGKGKGPWVGLPIQKDQGGTVTLRAATVLFKATSGGAANTTIDVTEFD